MLKVTLILLGTIVVTSYRSVPGQTDSSPFYTSTGEQVSNSGVAISQDRLCKACRRLHRRCAHPENQTAIHYGDCLYIDNVGMRIVNDCMGRQKHYYIRTKAGFKKLFIKQTNWLDVWVGSYKEEHNFHRRFKGHKLMVYKVVIK